MATDLNTLDVFNFEMYVEHQGLGDYRTTWMEIIIGGIGAIRCAGTKANNEKSDVHGCQVRIWF